MISVRPANVEDHDELVKIAKTSIYTSSFSNRMMFSPDAAYEKQWIWCAEIDGEIVGLFCVRHYARKKGTKLYFLVVDPKHRNEGIGQALLNKLKEIAQDSLVTLDVAQENNGAVRFYGRYGFIVVGKHPKMDAWVMEWQE